MTFLSEQSFDEDGNIKTFIKKKNTAESVATQDDGSVKAQVRVKFEYGNLTAEPLLSIISQKNVALHIV